MIFLIDNYSDPKEIAVYESIHQITSMVEWQDILDEGAIIIGSDGKVYAWDDSKKTENGIVHGYSMKVIDTNIILAKKCVQVYETLNRPMEFLLSD